MIERNNNDVFGQSLRQEKSDWLHGSVYNLVKSFLERNLFVLEATLGYALALRAGSEKGEVIAAFRRMTGQNTENLLQNEIDPIIVNLPSFIVDCFLTQEVLVLESSDTQVFRDLIFDSGEEKFALCAPWHCGDSFLLVFLGYRPFEKKEKAFLENSTWLLAMASKQIKEQWESSYRANRLERIFESAKVLTSEKSIENRLELLANTAIELLYGDYLTLRLVQNEKLQLVTTRGSPVGFEMVEDDLGLFIDDWTMRKGEMVAIEDITAWPPIELQRQAKCLKSVVSVPMRLRDDVIGVLSVYSTIPSLPPTVILNDFLVIADQATIVIGDSLLMNRTALLKEVHHRVKNNLQMVAGLLSLAASSNQQSPIAKKNLQESINRVKTMAMVHGLLSERGEGLTDLKELVDRLAPLLLSLQLTNTRKVEIKVKGSAVFLGSKEATCLALAINEVLCNSLIHGIVDREGLVSVEIRSDKENLTLEIQDNGKGLTPGFDWRKQKGLGLKVIEALIERDLRGTFRLLSNQDGGTIAVIVVPMNKLRNRGVFFGTA